MTQLGDYKVRCDRCFREAESDNRHPYAIGHPFHTILTEDPFIRKEWEQEQALKWHIEMQKELETSAKEGKMIKRLAIQFCKSCYEYIKKHKMFELHFCPECEQEMEEINGMGNAAIPLQCVTCRREIK